MLDLFGFSVQFQRLILRLHEQTYAKFLVNGKLSKRIQITSGIKQGDPLACLLFIIGAEGLTLGLKSAGIKGITISKESHVHHLTSAFVDDTAIFLNQAKDTKKTMSVVEQFGDLSGLKVQQQKSHFISLAKEIQHIKYEGIPVLPEGATTRYLGVQVGIANLTDINWNRRIEQVKKRVGIMSQKHMSVPYRVLLLNAIFLPAILFTATFLLPTEKHLKSLENIQKNYLWHQTVSEIPSKHRIATAQVFMPRKSGGLGLLGISNAIRRQSWKTYTALAYGDG